MICARWQPHHLIAVCGAAAVVAGCASQGSVALPSRAAPASAARTPATPEAAAAQAYTEYWPVSVRAAKLPRDRARPLLEQHLTGEAMKQELAGAAEWQRKHFEPWGHAIVHVMTVEVKGRIARLTECQDASRAGVANARTHQLIPGTVGSRRVHIRAELHQGADGQWRLSQKEILETPCTPPSS